MEEVRTYIESGILELYVLGDLHPEERKDVEHMAGLYPEVKQELAEIESTMQKVSESFAIEPSSKVRNGFLSSINFHEESEEIKINEVRETPVLGILPSKFNFYKYAFAACLALLIVSIGALIVLNNNLQNSKQQLAQLQNTNQSYANQVNLLNQKIDKTTESLNILSNPDFKMVKLAGTPHSPSSKMMVAFNPKEQKVLIDLNSLDLPANDATHQYQLWALVDGKPVDLGVFDADKKNEVGLINMKTIVTAQAFAVTLEPKGGSKTPTMDQMMVMGAI